MLVVAHKIPDLSLVAVIQALVECLNTTGANTSQPVRPEAVVREILQFGTAWFLRTLRSYPIVGPLLTLFLRSCPSIRPLYCDESGLRATVYCGDDMP